MLPLVEEDTLSSSLSFRLGELVEDSERAESGSSGSRATPPRRFVALLPLSVFATLAVVAGPVILVAALVPHRGILWEALAVVLAVLGSVVIASVGARLWMRWPRSHEVIFAELMLWSWVRRFYAERHLARTRDLFESARKSGSTVSIELLTQLSDLHQKVDPYVHGHSRRVASYAARIAREMHLSPDEIASIETAALVHDIGKIYTPAEILHKPSRLTDREFAIVKLHARDGAEIVANAGDPQITALVRHHHERLDGNGYPDRIGGAEIPVGSRIIAVADTFDAITSIRPYRPPRSHKQAIDILSKEAGTQLDANVVAAFLGCYTARRAIARSAFASAVSEQVLFAIRASSAGLSTASVAQLLPALGAVGVLAGSPALHQPKVDSRYEAVQAVLRLVTGPVPVRAGNAKTVPPIRRVAGGRESPRVRLNPRGTNTTSPNTVPSTSTSTSTSTSQPLPSPGSHEPAPSPVQSGSEPPKPTPTPPTSPPVGVQPSPPTLPTRPAEAPSTPPVVISVPHTPVTVSVPETPGVISVPHTPVTISVPSVTAPAVSPPTSNLSSAISGVEERIGG
jgi:putative nucleotidyltransferase with HDIG domain